jgi:nitroreductase
MRAPTAGNLMLYSIIEVTDQKAKETLARTCDNQPFIARAPWVLFFLADYQKWFDTYNISGVAEVCAQNGKNMRMPQEGDLFLACCDALIAAQTAVIAAESLGIGSCYIGDIMENYETHRELFDLPRFVFPIALVCFGYPTRQQRERKQTLRFDRRFVVFENHYQRLRGDDFERMYHEREKQLLVNREEVRGARNLGQLMYNKKYNADFTKEMNRSVREILRRWREG